MVSTHTYEVLFDHYLRRRQTVTQRQGFYSSDIFSFQLDYQIDMMSWS